MNHALETVCVGVIGMGSAGRKHLRDYQSLPAVEVVGIVEADGTQLKAVGKEFEVETIYTDYRQLLDDPRLQAVSICTPPFLHREMVVAAAERGLHIHCEKPMALSLADCDAMIEACKKKDLILYVSFEPRQLPAFRRVKEMLSSGEYGEPLWLMDRRLLPATPGVWMPPPWFWRRELGGGLLIENGGHHLDYIRWVMGDVKRVAAQTATLRFKESMPPYMEDPNIEDIGIVTLWHENGTMSNLLNTCMVPCGDIFHLEAATPTHYMALNRSNELTVDKLGEGVSKTVYHQWHRVINSAPHTIECIRQHKTPMCTGEDGRASLELALAALESARTAAPVDLPLPNTARISERGVTGVGD
jgi:myo-inositol 2-dehydrogenase/D-chiro-inositol 1-dehydrogenase/scyllo-inositol 2-dehydrogenase (NAD+)